MTDTAITLKESPDAPAETAPIVAGRSAAETGERNLAVGYLRAFITVLVVAHHALIAYMGGLPKTVSFTKPPYAWGAFPVQDPHTFSPFGLIVSVNDIFFMSLMFFISGLFVWDGLKRKGAGGFLRDRIVRLGVPFAIAAGLLAPVAYYPAYLATGADPAIGAYAKAWLSLSAWVSGPAWFIWLLLAFGCVAAALYKLAPAWGERLARAFAGGKTRPLIFGAKLVAISAAAYLALDLVFGPSDWLSWGPFTVQAARLLHYGAYFAVGIGVGALPLNGGLLAPDGVLQRRWRSSIALAIVAMVVATIILIASGLATGNTSLGAQAANGIGYTLACAAISLAYLAGFVHFVRKRSAVWDSLSANAYGIYLVHYVFVTWIQFALLRSALPGVSKGLLTVAAALALSWATTAALRRIPLVARVI
jgi:peptidoglycan/LPS O-acetylase OafA/YrhL